jgi:hypothetical protein
MRDKSKPAFELGRIAISKDAFDKLSPDEAMTILERHVRGDWGEVSKHDADENEFALDHDLRLMSVYRRASGQKLWVITEADRSITTIMFPEDY